MAMLYYAQDVYNRFDKLSPQDAKEIADAASAHSMTTPLWMVGPDKKFHLPIIGNKSGVYCMTVMSAYLVWTQCHVQNIGLISPSPMLAACRDALNMWYLETKRQPAWKESEA